ncbi:uncharacterized protein LOC134205381 [Armigeres subalbatus]|uniref:uncharacterized protein LOC134205381 n=1 Tax=Armigeres subalbatus TaxID=124917 RepID=UPI002ED2E934
MNKSWKSFDTLLSTPSPRRTSKICQRDVSTHSSSRAIAQLKPTISPRNRPRTSQHTEQTNILFGDENEIEDISSDEDRNDRMNQRTNNSETITCQESIVDCSATSLDPKDVTICEKSSIASDIEDVSESEGENGETRLDVSETVSSDSDCEAIHCRKKKRLKLDFINRKSPGCGRRITDDMLVIENATDRAAGSIAKSYPWNESAVADNSLGSYKKSHTKKRTSTWKRLDESFTDSNTKIDSTTKSPTCRKWKALDDTFRASSPTEIQSDLTPENSVPPKTNTEATEHVGETSFYDPTLYQQWPSRVKFRENCPLSRFNQVLLEKSSIQTFWLYERNMGLVSATKSPVVIESISRILGRIAISYLEPDEVDPGASIEHILYVDPSEKQLRTLKKGSAIEVEYDLMPHKLSSRKIVHLGVCKIRAVH